MAIKRPAQATYLTCPRCGLVVLKGSDGNGSPFCPDCWDVADVVVKMDVMTAPTDPPGSTSDE